MDVLVNQEMFWWDYSMLSPFGVVNAERLGKSISMGFVCGESLFGMPIGTVFVHHRLCLPFEDSLLVFSSLESFSCGQLSMLDLLLLLILLFGFWGVHLDVLLVILPQKKLAGLGLM